MAGMAVEAPLGRVAAKLLMMAPTGAELNIEYV